jgi:hypothetical protein
MFDAEVRKLSMSLPLSEQGRFLVSARYWQIHQDPGRRELARLLASALGFEGLGSGLAPSTPQS